MANHCHMVSFAFAQFGIQEGLELDVGMEQIEDLT